MTRFVHIEIATRHAGADRLEAAASAAGHLRHHATSTRGLATILLSAIAAAVMVAAYQVMDSVAEGHLLVIWIALWAVAFATLALFAGSARSLAARLKASADAWSRRLAEARSDERLWEAARRDSRVMSDLQAAISRNENDFTESMVAKGAALRLADAEQALPAAPAASLRPYQRLYI